MSDLIRRENAIATIGVMYERCDTCDITDYRDLMLEAVKVLPSADRPQGEWKPKNHHTDYCSNCGFEETQWRTADYNFCPSCGARMNTADTPQTDSTGSPIGDYRDGVGAWQTDCGWSKPNE